MQQAALCTSVSGLADQKWLVELQTSQGVRITNYSVLYRHRDEVKLRIQNLEDDKSGVNVFGA